MVYRECLFSARGTTTKEHEGKEEAVTKKNISPDF